MADTVQNTERFYINDREYTRYARCLDTKVEGVWKGVLGPRGGKTAARIHVTADVADDVIFEKANKRQGALVGCYSQVATSTLGPQTDLLDATVVNSYVNNSITTAEITDSDISDCVKKIRRCQITVSSVNGRCFYNAKLIKCDITSPDARIACVPLYGLTIRGVPHIRCSSDVFVMGPVGTRQAQLAIYRNAEDGVTLETGCFCGSYEEFKVMLDKEDPAHDLYREVVPIVVARMRKWIEESGSYAGLDDLC